MLPVACHGPVSRRCHAALIGAVTVLAGCAMDSEASARDLVARYLHPGAAQYFRSDGDCTAAVFEAVTGGLKSTIRLAGSIGEAGRLLDRHGTVGFRNANQSPNEISKRLAARDGAGRVTPVISTGVIARRCMNGEVQGLFAEILQNPDATLIYDQEENAIIVLDAGRGLILLGRGDV